MTENATEKATREGARDTCPTWCTTDHDDTGNDDMHTTDIVKVPAVSSDSWNSIPNAELMMYATTFGPGLGVTVEIGVMKQPGATWAQGGSLTARAAGVIAEAMARFATYTDTGTAAELVPNPSPGLLAVLAYYAAEDDSAPWTQQMDAALDVATGLGLITGEKLSPAGHAVLAAHTK